MYAPDQRQRRALRRQRGLSIIEVMVGMVVSLLVGLAAAGAALTFSASQRQGIGTGGSMLNSATALAAIRDDIASAGLGFFGDRNYLCEKLNFSVGDVALMDGADFMPLRITPVAGGLEIDIVWGLQVASGANVLLNKATDGSATAEVRSLLPVSNGQAVLIAPPNPGQPCLVRTVTEVTASTDDTPQTLTFGSVGKYNKVAFATMPTFPVNDYPNIGRVALMGDVHWSRYMLSGTTLKLQRPMEGLTVDLMNNVIALRAEYGIAATGGTSLESWTPPTGTFATLTSTTLKRVRAVRVGMVTRSAVPEKPDSSGTCRASSSKPKDPFDSSVEITPDVTDWQCYRYRTAVVVVPLRNLLIGMKP